MAGCFLHLHLALRAYPAAFGQPVAAAPPTLAAFLAGTLAPDAGYYPGGPAALSALVHHGRNGALTRSLLAASQSDEERAFTGGWALHIEADTFIHPLVNAEAARLKPAEFARRPDLWHKRLEWGMDRRLLDATEQGPPLWSWPVTCPSAPALLARATAGLEGATDDPAALEQGMEGLQPWVHRIVRLLRSGPLRRFLARQLERWPPPAEDVASLWDPILPDDEVTLDLLRAGDRAVALFQRGWTDGFADMHDRDLDTGEALT